MRKPVAKVHGHSSHGESVRIRAAMVVRAVELWTVSPCVPNCTMTLLLLELVFVQELDFIMTIYKKQPGCAGICSLPELS